MATFPNRLSALISPLAIKTNHPPFSKKPKSPTSLVQLFPNPQSNPSFSSCSCRTPHTALRFKGLNLPPSHRSAKMAGLSVLLEMQKGRPNYTHIISKTSILKNSSTCSLFSPSSSSGFSTSPFLERCYLCRKKLQGIDIYMYRGDRAFCSEECRCRQILMDEERVRGNCSLAAASASGKRMERARPGGWRGKTRAP